MVGRRPPLLKTTLAIAATRLLRVILSKTVLVIELARDAQEWALQRVELKMISAASPLCYLPLETPIAITGIASARAHIPTTILAMASLMPTKLIENQMAQTWAATRSLAVTPPDTPIPTLLAKGRKLFTSIC